MRSNQQPPAQSIASSVEAIRQGTQTSVSLIEAARLNAERFADLNPLAWVDWNQAAAQAAQCDQEAKAGRLRGPLHGIPVSIKDLYKVQGTTMRAGTHAALPTFDLPEATVVTRLRDAGAIIFGTTNLHEIALGATGENNWTGDVKNPFDPARQSGGSSSGAGVCVATGIGMAGVGSDTGGSVRIPANFCGVVGFKPSFGAIPLAGALHLSWTCDHAGPLARSVADARLLYEVMSGRSAANGVAPRAPRLGVPKAWLASRMEESVRVVFDHALTVLRSAGAEIVPVDGAVMDRAWVCYSPIVRAEAAFVHRAALAAGAEGFSDGVLQPMRAGQALAAVDYLEAMSQAARVKVDLAAIVASVDAMMLPTASALPPFRGQNDLQVAAGTMPVRQLVLGQTLPFNLGGLPAITLPMGQAQGLPVGLQLVGAAEADADLLALAAWCETSFDAASIPMARITN